MIKRIYFFLVFMTFTFMGAMEQANKLKERPEDFLRVLENMEKEFLDISPGAHWKSDPFNNATTKALFKKAGMVPQIISNSLWPSNHKKEFSGNVASEKTLGDKNEGFDDIIKSELSSVLSFRMIGLEDYLDHYRALIFGDPEIFIQDVDFEQKLTIEEEDEMRKEEIEFLSRLFDEKYSILNEIVVLEFENFFEVIIEAGSEDGFEEALTKIVDFVVKNNISPYLKDNLHYGSGCKRGLDNLQKLLKEAKEENVKSEYTEQQSGLENEGECEEDIAKESNNCGKDLIEIFDLIKNSLNKILNARTNKICGKNLSNFLTEIDAFFCGAIRLILKSDTFFFDDKKLASLDYLLNKVNALQERLKSWDSKKARYLNTGVCQSKN